jgi:hypothetical protein
VTEEPGSSEAHSRLVKECVEELALRGYPAWPNQTGMAWRDRRPVRFGKKGSGDVLTVLPRRIAGELVGVHGEIECKTGGAVQSKKQKAHMRVVLGCGAVYLVIRSRDELKGWLDRNGYVGRPAA